VLACGGTAGHVHPALAVAEAWRRVDPTALVTFAGAHGGLEERLATAEGYGFVGIRAAPFFGVGYAAKLRALAAAAAGARDARRVLRHEGGDLVVGFGGYAAAPVVLAAASLRIPVVVHESNVALGIGNRLVAPFARQVLLGFEVTVHRVRRPALVTGIPVGGDIVRAAAALPRAVRPMVPWRVVVAGGTYGSRFLDGAAPELLGRLAGAGRSLTVRHLAGDGDVARIRASYRAVGVAADVQGFVAGMAATLAWADFAITSAGAVTLAELAVAGVPTLVVPQTAVALDHQTHNAGAFADVTGARWVSERAWDSAALAAHLDDVLASPDTWGQAAAGMRRFARHDASELVVRACLPYLTARRLVASDAAVL